MGTPVLGKAALRPVMQSLIQNFRLGDWREVSILVDGERAALHWRADVAFATSGKTAQFDVFDYVAIGDGKIASFHQSTDSARVKALI